MMCKLHTFAAVTRYTPTAGLGFLQGPLSAPPRQLGKPVRGASPASYTNGDGARPQLGQAPAPTELAAPKNSPARRGSKTELSNVIKHRTI